MKNIYRFSSIFFNYFVPSFVLIILFLKKRTLMKGLIYRLININLLKKAYNHCKQLIKISEIFSPIISNFHISTESYLYESLFDHFPPSCPNLPYFY